MSEQENSNDGHVSSIGNLITGYLLQDHLHVSDYFRDHPSLPPGSNSIDAVAEHLGEILSEMVDDYLVVNPNNQRPKVKDEVIQSFVVVDAKDLVDLSCSICLEEFGIVKDEEIRQLPACRHKFHLNCLKMWLEQRTNCPTCRDELETDDPVFEAFKKRQASFIVCSPN
jgi:hypothetical protein